MKLYVGSKFYGLLNKKPKSFVCSQNTAQSFHELGPNSWYKNDIFVV